VMKLASFWKDKLTPLFNSHVTLKFWVRGYSIRVLHQIKILSTISVDKSVDKREMIQG